MLLVFHLHFISFIYSYVRLLLNIGEQDSSHKRRREVKLDSALPNDKEEAARVKMHEYQRNHRARLKDTGNTETSMIVTYN